MLRASAAEKTPHGLADHRAGRRICCEIAHGQRGAMAVSGPMMCEERLERNKGLPRPIGGPPPLAERRRGRPALGGRPRPALAVPGCAVRRPEPCFSPHVELRQDEAPATALLAVMSCGFQRGEEHDAGGARHRLAHSD